MLLLLALACGSTAPSDGPVNVTFIDPDGVDWIAEDAAVQGVTFTGAGCAPTTWYQVSGGDPQLYAWFALPESGFVASSAIEIIWGSNDANSARVLQGGIGELLQVEDIRLEYQITSAQDCTHPAVTTDGEAYVCSDQVSAATILIEGDLAGIGVNEDGSGIAQGTDDRGADVCGGVPPGA